MGNKVFIKTGTIIEEVPFYHLIIDLDALVGNIKKQAKKVIVEEDSEEFYEFENKLDTILGNLDNEVEDLQRLLYEYEEQDAGDH